MPILFLVAASGTQALSPGDPAPRVTYEDIDGRKGSSLDYQGWIIVYSFANRENNKALTTWIQQTGKIVAHRHPAFRVAYISFADVKVVPGFLQGLVRPILSRIQRKTVRDALSAFEQDGIRDVSSHFAFCLVPDWTGEYLRAFGISDASSFCVWVVSSGRVVAEMHQSQPDLDKSFLEAFDALPPSASSPETRPLSSPGQP